VVVEELREEGSSGALDLGDEHERLADFHEPRRAVPDDLVQVLVRPRLVPGRRRPAALEPA